MMVHYVIATCVIPSRRNSFTSDLRLCSGFNLSRAKNKQGCTKKAARKTSEALRRILSVWKQLRQRKVPTWSQKYVCEVFCFFFNQNSYAIFFPRARRHTHITAESIFLKCEWLFWVIIWVLVEMTYTFTLGDLEKEKLRLQNIMSTGQEGPTTAQPSKVSGRRDPSLEEETDRFQEGGN